MTITIAVFILVFVACMIILALMMADRQKKGANNKTGDQGRKDAGMHEESVRIRKKDDK